MSINSNDSMGVQVTDFKKYLRVTEVRYLQLGPAIQVQENNERNLEETIRQIEQKVSTDLKTIKTDYQPNT